MKMFDLKVMGIVVSAVGTGVSLVSSYIDEKKLDLKIEKKVEDALAKRAVVAVKENALK